MIHQDYLLIGVDPEKKYAIRLLSLKYGAQESLALKRPPGPLQKPYLDFLLGSVILGSRAKDQETVLYKLHFFHSEVMINCEVNPLGGFRSAFFPKDNLDLFETPFEGTLQASVLNRKNQVYTSSLKIVSSDIPLTLEEYLAQSIQTPSVLQIHADSHYESRNYALWIEKLPGTSQEDWQGIASRFADKDLLENSILDTEDPDVICQRLFPFPLQILMVLKPKPVCACTVEAFQRALILLPKKDLVEVSVGGKGLESECEYCGRIWRVEEDFIQQVLQSKSS